MEYSGKIFVGVPHRGGGLGGGAYILDWISGNSEAISMRFSGPASLKSVPGGREKVPWNISGKDFCRVPPSGGPWGGSIHTGPGSRADSEAISMYGFQGQLP